jgi:hypothetical protein
MEMNAAAESRSCFIGSSNDFDNVTQKSHAHSDENGNFSTTKKGAKLPPLHQPLSD